MEIILSMLEGFCLFVCFCIKVVAFDSGDIDTEPAQKFGHIYLILINNIFVQRNGLQGKSYATNLNCLKLGED